ncbi:class A beta-lactamase [Bordetella sp. LUAb4]|uniref:class A beta-lactamase n=1 Tax=Bordetella sp. LUAb4 TaxID=2843195 RepID=UPI001E5BE9BE|nr:class A beta-lactamase [Bordetella sp. LUAb4]
MHDKKESLAWSRPARLSRRRMLALTAAAPLMLVRPAFAATQTRPIDDEYARLEQAHQRRLGIYAVDTGSGKEVAYRADERFAVCSTFKAVLAAAVLAKDAVAAGSNGREAGVHVTHVPQPEASQGRLLDRRIVYGRDALVTYSPITGQHADAAGMSVAELCAAAIQYSDNTAGNLLLRLLGGPAALTAFARGHGNESFRLDRYETALNTAIPGDERDTSTPADMGRLLRTLMLGDALPAAAREQLKTWMLGNKTGDRRIRAATPAGWLVADKTGTGDYASANDIGVIWPPGRPPIVMAIYTTSRTPGVKADDDLIAQGARIAYERLK